ncbi:HelD family protein [Actinomadura mexicana]|uniref:UvrD-like helicase C-terminal domain-containing protein n=1 Tax=Actinomadura mexicana TaxID=134959 RepID=A0A239ENV9_9ACTN|nr:AAA family ATPase [Actinomadura mexicana]SNS46239.1 UvrD-like helicase C-terminal domain-containing protein [Actinomadura mexicana]
MSSQVNGRPTGPGGTVKDREIAVEQRYVDTAYARLEEMRADAQAMIREGYRQSLAGTKGSLVDRDAMVHQAALRVQALDVADDGLVFGRLDLASREVRYVGRVGVRTGEHDSLVIDWRAPAAEDFYRATPEDPRGVVRRRVLHSRGHTVVDLEDDLLDPEASDGMTVIGDGAFLASLARTREGAMRDIVATIQREQDEVIRAPADGTVLVRGAPGTGKTAVALHRVAYLLFRHRRRFGSRGVLVVGPNRRFTAYIERVLPSLGEGSATLRSLGDLVDGVTATVHDTPRLARVKGAEAMVTVLRRAVADHAPGAPDELRVVFRGVVVTLDRARLDRIRNEVHRRSRGSVNAARGRAAEMLLDALWHRFGEIGGPEAAEAEEGAEAGLWNAILAADGLGSLDEEPARGSGGGNGDPKRARFDARVREQRAFTDFLVAWWPIRGPLDVLRSLGDPARLRAAAGRDLDRADVGPLAASWAGDGAPLSYQDVALLDELDALLGSPPRPSRRRRAPSEDDPFVVDGVNILTGEEVADETWEPEMQELTTSMERLERSRRVDDGVVEERPEYAHLVVDEAQDLSPMQWRMLGRRGRQASWTIVEDPAQSAWEDLAAARRAMEAALGGERPSSRGRRRNRKASPPRARHEYELTTNYRNSTEIAAVSARVLARALPEARPARAVRTSGIEPVVQVVPEPGLGSAARAAVEELLGQVEGTIGLIVPLCLAESGGQASLFGEPATAWDAADRDRLGAGLPERVQVLDVLEAKGLEFDAAVIVAPETVAAQSPRGLRVLYVAVSRATQRLTVLTADPQWRDALITG